MIKMPVSSLLQVLGRVVEVFIQYYNVVSIYDGQRYFLNRDHFFIKDQIQMIADLLYLSTNAFVNGGQLASPGFSSGLLQ